MSASNSGPGGVKNLRAMFEKPNDQSTSPPSRGRSPNGSISSVSSRQLSKVRTSFVAVERPGELGQASQLGLRKTSDVDSLNDVKEEGNMESPEDPGLGLILKGSPFETTAPTKPAAAPKKATLPSKSEIKPANKSKANGQLENVSSVVNKLQTSDHKVTDGMKKEQASNTNNAKPVKSLPTRVATKPSSPTATKKSPSAADTSPSLPQQTPATPTRSSAIPMASKIKGGPAKIKGVIESAERANQERQAAAVKDVKPPSVASKPTAASRSRASLAPKDTAGEKTSDHPEALPIRSTKLPAAATATTAASAARREAYAQPEASKAKPAERKTTVPQAPRAASASTRASLARKSSRPSLANGNDKSKPRASNVGGQADEGFLARMTRPTASTSQKAHEKGSIGGLQVEAKRAVGKAKEVIKKPSRRSINPAQKSDETKNEAPNINGGETTLLPVENKEMNPLVDPEILPSDSAAEERQTPPQQAEVVS